MNVTSKSDSVDALVKGVFNYHLSHVLFLRFGQKSLLWDELIVGHNGKPPTKQSSGPAELQGQRGLPHSRQPTQDTQTNPRFSHRGHGAPGNRWKRPTWWGCHWRNGWLPCCGRASWPLDQSASTNWSHVCCRGNVSSTMVWFKAGHFIKIKDENANTNYRVSTHMKLNAGF